MDKRLIISTVDDMVYAITVFDSQLARHKASMQITEAIQYMLISVVDYQ